MDGKRIEYKSTAIMFKDFIAGYIWQDMKATIEEAIELTRDGLEAAGDWDTILKLQGDAEALKRILVMPEVILEDLEELKEKDSNIGENYNPEEELDG